MILVVLVDALRHDYVASGCAALERVAKSGLSGDLIPSFGFEPDGSYLAGLHPDEADGAAQFWHDPNLSPFRFIPSWFAVLDGMPRLPQKILRRLFVAWARRRCPSPQLSTARIPFALLPHFAPSARVGLDQPGFCQSKTVFDHLRGAGKAWLYHGVPTRGLNAESALQRAKADLHPPVEFAYFLIGNLDRVGHKYGPDSPERAAQMSCVDEVLGRLYTLAASRFDELHFLVFGDHGMATVVRHLNIQQTIQALPCRPGRDYLVFLDSTMARFWFFDAPAREEVWKALNRLEGGHWITPQERDRYHLNYRHSRFGDGIFLADPGVLILPNFYQGGRPVRGMHGYAPETPDQQSAFVLHSPRIRRGQHCRTPQDMRRVFPTLLDLLDLPVPNGLGVESLLREVPSGHEPGS